MILKDKKILSYSKIYQHFSHFKVLFFTGYYTQFPTNSKARRAREVQFTERRSALAPMNSVLFATPVLQQQCYYSSVLFFNYL